MLVREAGLIALRENENATSVDARHFLQAMKKVRASITPDMIKFYESWWDRIRQMVARTRARAESLYV